MQEPHFLEKARLATTRAVLSKESRQARQVARKVVGVVPHALGAFIVAAHASEFTRIVTHASLKELVIAAGILSAWLATRGGHEEI